MRNLDGNFNSGQQDSGQQGLSFVTLTVAAQGTAITRKPGTGFNARIQRELEERRAKVLAQCPA